jgi:mRNA interferase MazF
VVARGEVWWAEVGTKTRPVVILTRDAVVGRLRSLVVAPCTTTIRGLHSEVSLGPEEGLPRCCVVNLDNVTLVDAQTLRERITTLGDGAMAQICHALAIAVGCDRITTNPRRH